MGTEVYYNGIRLSNVTTRQWQQEVIYDQSNTDTIGQRFNLTFEAICHIQTLDSQTADVQADIARLPSADEPMAADVSPARRSPT